MQRYFELAKFTSVAKKMKFIDMKYRNNWVKYKLCGSLKDIRPQFLVNFIEQQKTPFFYWTVS